MVGVVSAPGTKGPGLPDEKWFPLRLADSAMLTGVCGGAVGTTVAVAGAR